jgi:hydroxyacylglutathione hydrolase
MLHIQSFTFNPVAENSYIIYNGNNNAAVVDPGCYFAEERDVLRQFTEEKQLKLNFLLNTHCHLDHVFGNRFVHETWGLELYCHEKERPVLAYAPTSGLMWNLPFDNYDGPLHFLNPGDTVKLDEDELQVLFTPGHSPGSISFYAAKEGFVVGGDVLFRESIGRTDLPGGNHETLLTSIRTQLFTLPNETVVYSGHGEPTTIGYEKANNPYLK